MKTETYQSIIKKVENMGGYDKVARLEVINKELDILIPIQRGDYNRKKYNAFTPTFQEVLRDTIAGLEQERAEIKRAL